MSKHVELCSVDWCEKPSTVYVAGMPSCADPLHQGMIAALQGGETTVDSASLPPVPPVPLQRPTEATTEPVVTHTTRETIARARASPLVPSYDNTPLAIMAQHEQYWANMAGKWAREKQRAEMELCHRRAAEFYHWRQIIEAAEPDRPKFFSYGDLHH